MNKAQLIQQIKDRMSETEGFAREYQESPYMRDFYQGIVHGLSAAISMIGLLEELDIRTVLDQLESIAKDLKPNRDERVFFGAVIGNFKEKFDEQSAAHKED